MGNYFVSLNSICHQLVEIQYTKIYMKGLTSNKQRMVEEDVTLRACNLGPNYIMDDGAIDSTPEGAKSDAKRGRLVCVVKYFQRILTIDKDGKSADRSLNDVIREINFITSQ